MKEIGRDMIGQKSKGHKSIGTSANEVSYMYWKESGVKGITAYKEGSIDMDVETSFMVSTP